MAVRYHFRPVTPADLPMLRAWRAVPEVARWWGPWKDPEGELAGRLADPSIALWIVEHAGRPFAYAQDYACHGPEPHLFSYLPPGARGLDLYIGDPLMLDCGHGSALLRQHAERLFAAGAPALGTDPHPDNLRAIRAYEKAGFRTAGGGPVDTPWGRAILMELWPAGA